MKLVIDIDEHIYLDMKEGDFDYARRVVRSLQATIADAIINGTPLPKGHGRLIDADKLNIYDVSPTDGFVVMGVTEEDIDLASTIIETDKEG